MPKDVAKVKLEILLVEDNPADAELMRDRLADCDGPGKSCNVRWVMNSPDVIPFLRSPEMAGYMPNLIVVDYKMPVDGGRAVTEVKGDPEFRHIPLVVLTGTLSQRDICDIYLRGANCCYHKPNTLEEYDSLIQLITDHWLDKVCNPTCHPES